MEVSKKIALIGLGAIGCALVKQAKDEGTNISVICNEERKKRYSSNSFTINNQRYNFNYVSEPKGEKIDILLISVKFNQLRSAIDDLRPFINKGTIIISLLNGISSERIIESELNHENILHAYVIDLDTKKYGNKVEYTKDGKIVIGTPYKEREIILNKAIDHLSRTGLNIEKSDHILRDLWWKFMVNIGISQISALHRIPYGKFRDENIKKITEMAMFEVINVAKILDVELSEKDINTAFEKLMKWGENGRPSMLQDIENHRMTEVEAFSGELCKLGKLHNVPTPINEFLLHSIRYIERIKQ